MIQIKLYPNGFHVAGHANYAENGKDIVCSAVSALTQTAFLGVSRYTTPSYAKGDGLFLMTIHESSTGIEAILEAFKLGLRAIEEQYPHYVKVTEESEKFEARL